MRNRSIWLMVSLALLGLSLAFVIFSEPQAQVEVKKQIPAAKVSVIELARGQHQGVLSFYAEVKPHWSVELKSHVMGEVTHIAAMAGQRVKAGQLLLDIEDSAYKTQVAEAEQAHAEARLQLTEERIRLDIKTTADDKQALINTPRLDVAQKALATAKARLEEAENRLAYTRVKAPFSGIITRRDISLGQTVNNGEPLFELINSDKLDIKINLTAEQWQMLPENWREQRARLSNALGQDIGFARIKQGGGFANPVTRQYSIYLEVLPLQENLNLLPGEFIQVSLPGKRVSQGLQIPESALTRTGCVWFVTQDNRLLKTFPLVLFHAEGQVIIRPGQELDGMERLKVVTMPMASFLPGARVSPVNVQDVI